jgi:peptidase propeptide and YPEB domain protein
MILVGILLINFQSFSGVKERKKITGIKAKQIALTKVPGATFANVLEFDS